MNLAGLFIKRPVTTTLIILGIVVFGAMAYAMFKFRKSKGAVAALTRGLAVEYAPYAIRVNALAPGFVETPLTARALRNPGIQKALLDSTPMRRFGLPEEIAKAAVFLASDEASYITGAVLSVDGGMSANL